MRGLSFGCHSWSSGLRGGADGAEANPYQYTPTAEPVVAVDAATVAKVKKACEAQLKAEAASSKRELMGVPYKPHDLISVTFTGEVQEVSLPHDEVAWEVPTTWVSKVPDGSKMTSSKTCQFRKLQKNARWLP